ncbi:MAG: TonB family protein [Candidatus Accumulibacter sp.]|uniref:energy transducer TonB n=1 Tax=Accumulibacter sp. TaxID=2053492 RepID=UPI0025E34267|nr:TonB family protein [Accumulibacter sp.]MCM8597871.1 TonB family protein [Accumulibacter sp.]MCM8663357.1 TonB family protein [Accumulibacter sp.]
MNGETRQLVARWVSTHGLALALAVSLLLHGLVLSLRFKFPDASRAFQERALDIILVNRRSTHKPAEAQVKAQANLDNGGNTDLDRHAKTPLPPAPRHQEGDDLEHSQKRIQALEARQQRLATQAQSKAAISPKTDREVQPEPAPNLSGRDLARSALAMARLEGEIAKDLDDYNKRPRRKFIGTSAVEFRFAQYFEEWRLKVERIGTLNYPEAARGKLYGSLVLTVAINSDGTVAGIEINRSSGYKILDDAARRIVAMAAPFAAFPPAIRRDTDILEITRTWNFTQRDSLETGKATKR